MWATGSNLASIVLDPCCRSLAESDGIWCMPADVVDVDLFREVAVVDLLGVGVVVLVFFGVFVDLFGVVVYWFGVVVICLM